MEKRSGLSVGILEVGFGNLPSLQRVLRQIDFNVEIILDADLLIETNYLIIPGVGSFSTAMSFLNKTGLAESIKYRCDTLGKPTLGICLGAQILLEEGHEGGKSLGVGVFEGRVVKSSDYLKNKSARNGWDVIEIVRPVLDLYPGTKLDTYFNHDFIFSDTDENHVCAVANHGGVFPVILQKNQTFAVQFHPEKSQSAGLHLLKSFLGLTHV